MQQQRGSEAYVLGAVRTPFGRRGKGLAGEHPVDLLGGVLSAVLARSGVAPEQVDRLLVGCVEKTGEQAFNVGRTAWLAAGLPPGVPATTVDAQCGSSHEAVSLGHALIASGQADLVVVGGVESMSRVPMATTFTAGPGDPVPGSYVARYPFPDQFAAAESMAADWGISRADCDALAVSSNLRALAAAEQGLLAAHVLPTAGVAADETPRHSTADGVAALAPLGSGAVHTSATASKVADGASALVLGSAAAAGRTGIAPLARLVRSTLVGVSPHAMLSGPIDATRRLLGAEGLTVSDVDMFEVNEAFASVVLAWAEELKVDPALVNPLGGALAHGHPLGATGAALVGKASHELHRGAARRAVVAMCCGGGLGTGSLLEAV